MLYHFRALYQSCILLFLLFGYRCCNCCSNPFIGGLKILFYFLLANDFFFYWLFKVPINYSDHYGTVDQLRHGHNSVAMRVCNACHERSRPRASVLAAHGAVPLSRLPTITFLLNNTTYCTVVFVFLLPHLKVICIYGATLCAKRRAFKQKKKINFLRLFLLYQKLLNEFIIK